MVIPGVNCIHPILIKVNSDDGHEFGLTVGCGHCMACTAKRRREWTLRLIMESKMYEPDQIAFTTLTYNDANIVCTEDGMQTLSPTDLKNFMKRLRRRIDYKIRFFGVGEYGTRYHRPHYHLIIFGLNRRDWHFIDESWKKGFTLTKSFFNETCGYVAGYIQKKLFGNDVYDGKFPPFLRCSQSPSIGEDYFWKNIATICKQGFIKNGDFKHPIPRIFQRKAIEAGYLPACDLDELQLIQNDAIVSWLEHLSAQGVEPSDYEKNFLQIKANEYVRMNIKREIDLIVPEVFNEKSNYLSNL